MAELTELLAREAAAAAQLRRHYGLEGDDQWTTDSAERLRLEGLGYPTPTDQP